MPTCFTCNSWKGGFSLEMFRRETQQQVARARKYSRNFRMAEKFFLVAELSKVVEFYFERHKDANS
jgi:hypothetical protein